MLKVEKLEVAYGDKTVVQDVSFALERGEKLCILGPNGSGKTTLIKAIAGLLPFEGSILVCGEDSKKMSRKTMARKMALMHQQSGADFPYTVYETVSMGRYPGREGIFSRCSAKDRQDVMAAMEEIGIADLKDALITELSGGQRQSVFLARTFAQNPEIILLDEPTNHLDMRYKAGLMRSLRAWTRVTGGSVIGIFHDVALAFAFGDRILLLEEGKVVACAPPESFPMEILNHAYGMDVPKYMQETLKRWDTE